MANLSAQNKTLKKEVETIPPLKQELTGTMNTTPNHYLLIRLTAGQPESPRYSLLTV